MENVEGTAQAEIMEGKMKKVNVQLALWESTGKRYE